MTGNLYLTRNYEYRLRLNRAFQLRAEEVLEESRQFYNAALSHRVAAYKAENKSVTLYDQQRELAELRREYPLYSKTNCSIQREALDRVDKAFRAFFRRVQARQAAGFPRYKSSRRYNSFCVFIDPRHVSPLQGDKLRVASVGAVRVRLHRPLPEGAKIKQVRIVKRIDGWYAVLAIQFLKPELKAVNQEVVGVDLGIATFATLSSGEQIANPSFSKRLHLQLSKRAKRLACKPKSKSNHREVAWRLLGKTHLKVRRSRKHFHCNLAKDLTTRFGVIVVEDLDIKGMAKPKFAGFLIEASWGAFLERLESKAEEAGSKVVRVHPAYTSQTCPQCECIDALNRLTQAQFKCIQCGYANHADIVGAINIRARGAKLADQSACDNTAILAARKTSAKLQAKHSKLTPVRA